MIKNKDCNCKATKNIIKMIKTVDDINLSTSKTHLKERRCFNKIFFKILKYLVYSILLLLLFTLAIPILILIFILHGILKKPTILNINFLKLFNRSKNGGK